MYLCTQDDVLVSCQRGGDFVGEDGIFFQIGCFNLGEVRDVIV